MKATEPNQALQRIAALVTEYAPSTVIAEL